MSWFASSASHHDGHNLHSVSLAHDQEALFGPLVKEDTEWLCAGGFITETQCFYTTTATGGMIMVQVIHSSVGLWYPNIQFTFRYVEPSKGIHIFKSTNVTNFVTAPAKYDKRSSKSDQFSIVIDPASPNKYIIEGKHDSEVQISIVYEQLAEGWKIGAGPRGGFTYFGNLSSAVSTGNIPDVSAGSDGYCIHRFWPRCAVSGIVRVGTDVLDLEGSRGTFIHAIQGLRPNVLAAKWNFGCFQSTSPQDGVALTMMEFTTVPSYGSKKINIGSIVVGDKLVCVTAGGDGVTGGSSADHLDARIDEETGYNAPGQISFLWQGASLQDDKVLEDKRTKANVLLDLATSKPGEEYKTKGLVEKVDVLAHIPYLIKKFVNYAAGTKPFIYTWFNPAKASIVQPGESGPTTIEVDGYIFNEATFIS